MDKDIKSLIRQSAHFQEEDIDDSFFDKLDGEINPGSKVEIEWVDREETDKGYAFCLPNQLWDEGDIFLHITDVDNSEGIGDGEEVFIHLYKLGNMKKVKKISFR